MSTLNSDEQDLYDVAKSSLPKFLFQLITAAQEMFGASAKTFGAAKTAIKLWYTNTYILQSSGFWLDQHAKDRGTGRRFGETDVALQGRLRNNEDLVTKPALIAQVNSYLASQSLPETAAIVELRLDRSFFQVAAAKIEPISPALISDGETFTLDNGTSSKIFEFDKDGSVTAGHQAVNISAAVTVDDVVTAIMSSLSGYAVAPYFFTASLAGPDSRIVAVQYTDSSHAIIASEAVSNSTFKVTSGAWRAYFSRGYRMGTRVDEIVIILPYGSTSSDVAAVYEIIRQKKAGGIAVKVESRQNP